MEILNEDYVGKTPNIQAIEDLFRKHENRKGTVNSVPFVRNEGKIVTKMEELICKEFNFEEVVLAFLPTAYDNAATIGASATSIFDDLRGISNDITRTKEGGFAFKDKRNKITCIIVSANILENYSVEEIMSVLLHEIGHNFNKILFISKVYYKIFYWFFDKVGRKSYLNYIKGKKLFQSLRDKRLQKIEAQVNKRLSDDATVKASLRIQDEGKVESPKKDAFVEFVVGTIFASVILAVTIIGIPLSLLNLNGLFKLFESYKGEIDADKFAAQYGYSVGQSKSFTKMASLTTALKNTGIKADKDFIIEMESKIRNFMLALLFTDEHPDHAARIKNTLEYLDDEIRACKNPRIKKILQKQKKDTEEVLKDYATRIKKKEIDTSLDDIKKEYTYKFAGSETYEDRAK